MKKSPDPTMPTDPVLAAQLAAITFAGYDDADPFLLLDLAGEHDPTEGDMANLIHGLDAFRRSDEDLTALVGAIGAAAAGKLGLELAHLQYRFGRLSELAAAAAACFAIALARLPGGGDSADAAVLLAHCIDPGAGKSAGRPGLAATRAELARVERVELDPDRVLRYHLVPRSRRLEAFHAEMRPGQGPPN
jgi:hypothetical protein